MQTGFAKFLLAFVTTICDEDFRLFYNEPLDLLKGVLNRVSIEGISRLRQGSQNSSTFTGSGNLEFAAEFKRFMDFAYGIFRTNYLSC